MILKSMSIFAASVKIRAPYPTSYDTKSVSIYAAFVKICAPYPSAYDTNECVHFCCSVNIHATYATLRIRNFRSWPLLNPLEEAECF